jgi:hypothetical protein
MLYWDLQRDTNRLMFYSILLMFSFSFSQAPFGILWYGRTDPKARRTVI